MSLRAIRYYWIPDPLERGRWVATGDQEAVTSALGRAFESVMRRTSDRPSQVRAVIAPRFVDLREAEESAKAYERNLRLRLVRAYDYRKLKELLRFAGGLAIGYLLFIASADFWAPIEAAADAIDQSLGAFAKWSIIAFFPLRAFVMTFGTGLYVPLPPAIAKNPVFRKIPLLGRIRSIGTAGRWSEIADASRVTRVFARIGASRRREFLAQAEAAVRNVERKLRRASIAAGAKAAESIGPDSESGRLLRELSALVDELSRLVGGAERDRGAIRPWSDRFELFLRKATADARRGGFFPWGEIPKLAMMREELVRQALDADFAFAPLKVVHPGSRPDELFPSAAALRSGEAVDLDLPLRAEGLARQAESLERFLSLPRTVRAREEVYECLDRLRRARSRRERETLLERIASGFETLRNQVLSLHMREMPDSGQERCKDLSNIYHRLYLCFGKAACDLSIGYRKAFIGFLPLRSDRAQARRIRAAEDKADRILGRDRRHRLPAFRDRIVYGIARTWRRGLVFVGSLVFLLGSLASLYTLGPGEAEVETSLALGTRTGFLSRSVRAVAFGGGLRLPLVGRELRWHLPPPLVAGHRISLEALRTFTVPLVIGQRHPDSAWAKLIGWLSGPLGASYDTIIFTFGYVPREPESWARYDPDGLGPRRLARDSIDIVSEWSAEKLTDFAAGITTAADVREVAYVFDSYFKELSRKGVIEEYIRDAFSSTAFSSNIQYGSPLERLRPGVDAILGRISRLADESRADILMGDAERQRLDDSLDFARELVSDALEEAKEQARVQYGELRRDPIQLERYLRDPYGHIAELHDLEALWSSIQGYAWYLYNTEKLLGLLRAGEGATYTMAAARQGNLLLAEVMERLSSNDHLARLIDLRTARYEIVSLSAPQLGVVQQKWQDIL